MPSVDGMQKLTVFHEWILKAFSVPGWGPSNKGSYFKCPLFQCFPKKLILSFVVFSMPLSGFLYSWEHWWRILIPLVTAWSAKSSSPTGFVWNAADKQRVLPVVPHRHDGAVGGVCSTELNPMLRAAGTGM